jgi:hypothetical protein
MVVMLTTTPLGLGVRGRDGRSVFFTSVKAYSVKVSSDSAIGRSAGA